MQIKIVTSLDKVFPNVEPTLCINKATMLKNERFNFQLCIYNDKKIYEKEVKVKVLGSISKYCKLRVVENIPSQLAEYSSKDEYYIFNDGSARIYPDLLRPFEYGDLIIPIRQCRSIWCTVFCEKGIPKGKHKLKFVVSSLNGEEVVNELDLEVIDAFLPKNDLLYTNWFHYDCIAQYYKVTPWTKKFFKLLGSFIDTAVAHGVNIMYTPVFTPPLDTKIGWERQDVQLVKVVEINNDFYEFDFSLLDKFIDFCVKRGIEYFEISHLTTQWGAKACPKIMAYTKDGYKKIFGWETSSFGEKYKIFLSQFLPKLDDYLKSKGIAKKVFFHISDEPTEEQFEEYKTIAEYIKSYLMGYQLMDASSTVSNKYIDIPILSTTHIPEYADENVWVYYCCTACNDFLSNRFFNVPSQRTRIFGIQLYEQDRKGFLHWGFNFYNTVFSYRAINPYQISDAGGEFPSGDSYVVYPGEDGALDSLRLEVFYDGLQDRMALKLLEKSIGRDAVVDMLHKEGVIGWKKYPKDARWHIEFRERLNELIKNLKK